ncbi:hypothetical protein C4E04_17710 [Microvirga sp. 17 mud 1-3]|nr:hypothetical protein C4E04_17710 [Microvirga sp. 17 mud 1-3]
MGRAGGDKNAAADLLIENSCIGQPMDTTIDPAIHPCALPGNFHHAGGKAPWMEGRNAKNEASEHQAPFRSATSLSGTI